MMAELGAIGVVRTKNPRLMGGVFSGKVYDVNGNPTANVVRAYNRETGELSGGAISDPNNDGHYVLYVGIKSYLKQHFIVEIDSANLQNARIFDLESPL